MSEKPAGNNKTTLLGIGVFAVLVALGLWHGVIGPRVIEPIPGTQEAPPPPDPSREPPRE